MVNSLKYIFVTWLLITLSSISYANSEEGFTLQILEPTGGKIQKPNGWFYKERHRSASSLYWVISKEDPSQGYETGLAIQFMIGIKDHTGLTPEEFTKKNIDVIAKSAKQASLCKSENVGFFNRQCLEIEEEKKNKDGIITTYHVLYSFFWNNEMDMTGVTIAGTPSEQWPKYKDIFNKMSEIELIDLERFKEL